ncbi:MAG TPA: hypothetical protein VGM21_16275 [Actinomycetota bacterium]|jgi:hypothetical protein
MSADPRCGTTLGGREALKHPCTLARGHGGRCSWWEWHHEQVARHEHTRRWRFALSPPPFRLENYKDFFAKRFTRAGHHPGHAARQAPAARPPDGLQQRGGGGPER